MSAVSFLVNERRGQRTNAIAGRASNGGYRIKDHRARDHRTLLLDLYKIQARHQAFVAATTKTPCFDDVIFSRGFSYPTQLAAGASWPVGKRMGNESTHVRLPS